MKCKKCGTRLLETSNFCPQCGAKIYKNNIEKITKKSLTDQKYIPGCSSMRGDFIAANGMIYFIYDEVKLYQVNVKNPRDFQVLYSTKLYNIDSLNYFNGKLFFVDSDIDAGKCYLISLELSTGRITEKDISSYTKDSSFMMSENGKGYYIDSTYEHFVTVDFRNGEVSTQKMPDIEVIADGKREIVKRFSGTYIHHGYAYCSLRDILYTIIKFPVNNVSNYCRMDGNGLICGDHRTSPVHIYDNKLFTGDWISGVNLLVADVNSLKIINELDYLNRKFTVFGNKLFLEGENLLLNMNNMKVYKLSQDYSARDVAFMDGNAYLYKTFNDAILKIPISKLFKLDIKKNEYIDDQVIFTL